MASDTDSTLSAQVNRLSVQDSPTVGHPLSFWHE